eukprot:GHVS01063190.1.p1 GENE.GHVS01063190.1~~GHVS01063190.1.p1  ORF type:complete len:209 (+),score=24.56 GHVS01063190.1:49-675(+)
MCVHVSVMCTCYLQQSPEVLQQIHQDTFQAGADVVSTATYQVSVPRLLAEGLGVAEAKEVIASSVQLVKAAAVGAGKPNGQIAGACGPYGAYLADASEYTGNYDIPEEEMKNFHRPRIEALVSSGIPRYAWAGVDVILMQVVFTDLLWREFQPSHSRAAAGGCARAVPEMCGSELRGPAARGAAGCSRYAALSRRCEVRRISQLWRDF